MKTAEEIIKQNMHPVIYSLRRNQGFSLQEVISLMNHARKEAIEECAKINKQLTPLINDLK